MSFIQFSRAIAGGITAEKCKLRPFREASVHKPSQWILHGDILGSNKRKRFACSADSQHSGLISDQKSLNYEVESSEFEEKFTSSRNPLNTAPSIEEIELTGRQVDEKQAPTVLHELVLLSIPAIIGQAIEPIAQLMATAFIGRIGVLELAAAGVSQSIFLIIFRVFSIPLLSVATSFVAEDISKCSHEDTTSDGRRILPSVSSAIALSLAVGLFEAALMTWGSGAFLNLMGVTSASPMSIPAKHYLTMRALGAPALVVSVAIQGIFRGFKDMKTPLLCNVIGTLAAAIFFPVSMFMFRTGLTGAALSTVASQYIVTILMMWHLNKKTILQKPDMKNLRFVGYLRSGGFLLGKTISVATILTLSTSMVARVGALYVAAHQICLQLWLAVSLINEGQASAAQALIAGSYAKGEYKRVKEIAYSALKTGLITGICLTAILGTSLPSLAKVFTTNAEVQNIIKSIVLFVAGSQPLTAMALLFDGLHYGVSDFAFAGCSMVVVGATASAVLVYAASIFGLPAVWSCLTLFMLLRSIGGFWRLSRRNGPWWFLQDINKSDETEIA